MSLYVLGDTHFSSDGAYSMEVFGGKWKNYTDKIKEGLSVLKEGDLLVLCGDFSWGMSLSDTLDDFKLIDGFPGKKVLLKGNHDYFWDTVKKMKSFFYENDISTVDFLHNNYYDYEGRMLCGTRGWMYDNDDPATHDAKIFRRELMRLEFSLRSAREHDAEKEIIAFLHYPPLFAAEESDEITAVLKKYGVKSCYYGHLHGESIRLAFNGKKDGVFYKLVSADALDFKPFKIF
ncbi:MAG: metallophosphoesterase [Clostridia bacterium]|nr:metallophosphoesterase [Clostridia bacterium]